MGLHKMKNLLHSKGNHQQNKKIAYGIGENICYHQEVNIQNMKTAYTTKYQKNKQTKKPQKTPHKSQGLCFQGVLNPGTQFGLLQLSHPIS